MAGRDRAANSTDRLQRVPAACTRRLRRLTGECPHGADRAPVALKGACKRQAGAARLGPEGRNLTGPCCALHALHGECAVPSAQRFMLHAIAQLPMRASCGTVQARPACLPARACACACASLFVVLAFVRSHFCFVCLFVCCLLSHAICRVVEQRHTKLDAPEPDKHALGNRTRHTNQRRHHPARRRPALSEAMMKRQHETSTPKRSAYSGVVSAQHTPGYSRLRWLNACLMRRHDRHIA